MHSSQKMCEQPSSTTGAVIGSWQRGQHASSCDPGRSRSISAALGPGWPRLADGARVLARLEHLCSWLLPAAVCVVGITGWRAATGDRAATLGLQDHTLGSRPVYVMPNPSGLNAHTNHDDLVAHFRAVRELASAS